jgi:ADP-ribose pyrophosphatase YjhB (NUDIX family)
MLLEWSEKIAASARTGLAFSDNLYERERYEEILKVAAEIRLACDTHGEDFDGRSTSADGLFELWRSRVGEGIPGYVTPKVSVGAIVQNDNGELLLVQRGDSGVWFYPTGWADVGYSPAEVVAKEVKEETGIECRVDRVLAVLDGIRSGFTAIPMYSIVFLCQATGGTLRGHPLETRDVGWFSLDELPPPLPQVSQRIPTLAQALRGEPTEVYFDPPRP